MPLDFTRSWRLLSHSHHFVRVRPNTSSQAISATCENREQSGCACALAQAVVSQSFALGRLSCSRGVVSMMHSVSGGVEALTSSC